MRGDLQATRSISGSIFLSRVLGVVREAVFAGLFGVGAVADAFVVAFRIPNLLRDLLAEGALSAAFVPTFTTTEAEKGPKASEHLAALALSAVLIVTGLIAGAGVLFAQPIVKAISAGFGGDPQKIATAARLTQIMMPFLSLASVGALWMGILNARRRFLVPALGPVAFNLISIGGGAVAWILGGDLDQGIVVWAVATLLGGTAQGLMQAWALKRMRFRLHLAISNMFGHPGIRRMAALMAPAVLGVAAVQTSVFINTGFAGSLGDGPVTQLNYAFRLFFLPLGVFGVALATVTLTSVSEAAAKGDRELLAQRSGETVAAGWMLASASAVGLYLLAIPIVRLLYQHGQTSGADAVAIAQCLRMYVVGLAPYCMIKILAPAYYSVDRPRVPLIASVAGVATNIVFNALTYRELGAPGIALGTALGALVNLVILRTVFDRAIAPLPNQGRWKGVAALVVANALLGGLAGLGAEGIERLRLSELYSAFVWKSLLAGALIAVIALSAFAYAMVLKAWSYPGAQLLLFWRRPLRHPTLGRDNTD